jgi:small-conductance mechanosensitive channel
LIKSVADAPTELDNLREQNYELRQQINALQEQCKETTDQNTLLASHLNRLSGLSRKRKAHIQDLPSSVMPGDSKLNIVQLRNSDRIQN